MKTCMGLPGKSERRMTTAPAQAQSGNSVTVSGTIPMDAEITAEPEPNVGSVLGPALVCLLSETSETSRQANGTYATPPTEYTVV